MHLGFRDLISTSWQRTRDICFRPFSWKKWAMFTIVAFIAGQLIGGCSVNVTDLFPNKAKTEQTQKIKEVFKQLSGRGEIKEEVTEEAKKDTEEESKDTESVKFPSFLRFLIVPLVLLVIALIALSCWFGARFSFIFIDDVSKNDASIDRPYRDNRKEANSLFVWYMGIFTVFMLALAFIVTGAISSLKGAGVFEKGAELVFSKVIPPLIPWIFAVIFYVISGLLIGFIVVDIIQPIMYRSKVGVMKAWGMFFSLFAANAGNIAAYALVKWGLIVVASMLVSALTLAALVVLLIPGAIIGIIIYLIGLLISKILGALALPVLLFLGIMLGVIAFMALMFFMMTLFVPLAVFFRVLSLEYVERLSAQKA